MKKERIQQAADLLLPLAANYLQPAYVNPMSDTVSLTLTRILDSLIMTFLKDGIDLSFFFSNRLNCCREHEKKSIV